MSSIIFEDIFEVRAKNVDGKAFEKVSRIEGISEHYEVEVTLDYNTDIYALSVGDKFTLALAKSLKLDGKEDDGLYHGEIIGESLMDRYEYVMHGKCYKISAPTEHSDNPRMSLYFSFGGLLMLLQGDAKHLSGMEFGLKVYILVRKF